jgi:hypothetical protein
VSEGARRVTPSLRTPNPPCLLHRRATACSWHSNLVHTSFHKSCARTRAIGKQMLIHSTGRKPVTTDLVRRCELLICEMAVKPARWRATYSQDREQTRDKKHTRSQAGRVEVRKHRRPRAYTTPAGTGRGVCMAARDDPGRTGQSRALPGAKA